MFLKKGDMSKVWVKDERPIAITIQGLRIEDVINCTDSKALKSFPGFGLYKYN